MPNTKPALQAQITITANTNDWLDAHFAGGEETAQVTAGTYDDIHALAAAIQTALAGWESASGASVTVSDEGIVTISCNESHTIDWKTGTHGSDNADTHIGSVIGFSDAADDAAATSHAGDYQHMYGWYPPRYPTFMGPWKPMAVGGEMRHTMSGTNSKKLHAAFHHTYEVAFALISSEYVFAEYATGSDVNKDLETTWQEGAQGDFVTWYTDASDTGSGTKCYILSPHDWAGVVTRPHTDYHAYDLSMKFRKQES